MPYTTNPFPQPQMPDGLNRKRRKAWKKARRLRNKAWRSLATSIAMDIRQQAKKPSFFRRLIEIERNRNKQ